MMKPWLLEERRESLTDDYVEHEELGEHQEEHEVPLGPVGLLLGELQQSHVGDVQPVVVDEDVPHEDDGVGEIVEVHLLVVVSQRLVLDLSELLRGLGVDVSSEHVDPDLSEDQENVDHHAHQLAEERTDVGEHSEHGLSLF